MTSMALPWCRHQRLYATWFFLKWNGRQTRCHWVPELGEEFKTSTPSSQYQFALSGEKPYLFSCMPNTKDKHMCVILSSSSTRIKWRPQLLKVFSGTCDSLARVLLQRWHDCVNSKRKESPHYIASVTVDKQLQGYSHKKSLVNSIVTCSHLYIYTSLTFFTHRMCNPLFESLFGLTFQKGSSNRLLQIGDRTGVVIDKQMIGTHRAECIKVLRQQENSVTLSCNPCTIAFRWRATPKPLKYRASASASACLVNLILSASALCDAASFNRLLALISFILAFTLLSGLISVTKVFKISYP